MCGRARRGFSVLVLSVFIFSLFSFPHPLSVAEAAVWSGGIAADFDGGDGSAANPYEIATPEQLALLAEWVNDGKSADKHYRLTSDIDLGGRGWTPIGSGDIERGVKFSNPPQPFKGFFDGDGRTIFGLQITSPDKDCVGLFGVVSGDSGNVAAITTIKNLTISEPNVLGRQRVGGLAGAAGPGSNISGVDVQGGQVMGGVRSSDFGVGGLAGWLQGSTITSGCATASVSGGSYLGGLVGWLSSSTIISSHAAGSVSGTAARAGGLVGLALSSSTITSSYAAGSVSLTGTGTDGTDSDGAGGLVGSLSGSSKITSSYAAGSVSGNHRRVGGLVGHLKDKGSTITSSYAAGSVSGTLEAIGGLVGYNDGNGTIPKSAYDPQGTGMPESKKIGTDSNAQSGNIKSFPTKSGDWQNNNEWPAHEWSAATATYYPQLLAFSTAPDFAAWSALSVVPVILSGDDMAGGSYEDANNLKTPFALLYEDAAGDALAWRIDRDGAKLAISGDLLVVSPDMIGLSFDLYATNGGGREKMFRLTASDDLTTTDGLTEVSAPESMSASPSSLPASGTSARVELTAGDGASIKDVSISGPGVASSDILVNNGSFYCVFAEAGTYTVTATVWSKVVGDYWIYATDSATITATNPGPPHYASADIRSISITIDGVEYEGTLQPDGETWVVGVVPYGTDLSSVTPDIELWPNASFSPEPPYDCRDAVKIDVTAMDGVTIKSYRLIVEAEVPPAIETLILDALPDNARARLVENDDGTWTVEIVYFFDPNFDPASIESITIEAEGITGIRAYYVDEYGDATELRHVALSSPAAEGERLKITGFAAGREAVEGANIVKVTVRKKNDAATYWQRLDMLLSSIPGGTPPEDPTTGPTTGSSGGCSAGTGFALAISAACSAALLLAPKRRK